MQQRNESFTASKLAAIAAVEVDFCALRSLDDYQNDFDVVLAAIKKDGMAIKFASPSLRSNVHLVRAAVTNQDYVINEIDSSFKGDESFALFFFSFPNRGFYFNWFSGCLQKKKEVALAAVSSSGMSLSQMPGFADDGDVVEAAIASNAGALCYAGERFRSDVAFASRALQSCGSALEYVSPMLKGNPAVVMAALSNDGLALEHASEDMRSDAAVVVAAITQNGSAISYAQGLLKYNDRLVSMAVSQNGLALEHVLPGFKANKDIVLNAVAQNGLALAHIDPSLENDKDIASATVNKNGLALRYLKGNLKFDISLISAAIRQNPKALEYACKEVKDIVQGNRDGSFIVSLIDHLISAEFSVTHRLLFRESKLINMFFCKSNAYAFSHLFSEFFIDVKRLPEVCVNYVLSYLLLKGSVSNLTISRSSLNVRPAKRVKLAKDAITPRNKGGASKEESADASSSKKTVGTLLASIPGGLHRHLRALY